MRRLLRMKNNPNSISVRQGGRGPDGRGKGLALRTFGKGGNMEKGKKGWRRTSTGLKFGKRGSPGEKKTLEKKKVLAKPLFWRND